MAIERQLRGSGPSLLKIKEWAPYAGQDMPPPTLITNGDPTIEIRSGTFEEYIARHTPSGGGGGGGAGAGNSTGNGSNGNVPGVSFVACCSPKDFFKRNTSDTKIGRIVCYPR